MILFTSFIVSMLVTTLLTPAVKRLAYRFDFVDTPNSRKVHIQPMPRIGGLAIILGALAPLLIWLPLDRAIIAYSAGALLIILLALLDDKYDLSPFIKLAVQSTAVIIAILFGDLGVHQFHLFWHEFTLSPQVSFVLTVLFVLIVINGVNFSDGLDGLAGGMALLSLVALILLSYRVGAADITLICLVLAGGLLGFLLFNSHPAQVFMGEVGSQFLGYSLAVLTIYLTQGKTHIYSAFMPLLLIGLPLVDLVIVVVGRLARKKSPFTADRSHLHHRLLDMHFSQHTSVFILYLLQCTSIGMALAFRSEGDTFVLSLFVLFTILIASVLVIQKDQNSTKFEFTSTLIKIHVTRLNKNAIRLGLRKRVLLAIAITIIGYLLAGTIIIDRVGLKEGIIATILFSLLTLFHSTHFSKKYPGLFLRYILYLTTSGILFYVYLESTVIADHNVGMGVLFVTLSLLILLGIHLSNDDRLAPKTIDFLVILLALFLPVTLNGGQGKEVYWVLSVHLLVLFYGIELLLLSFQGRNIMNYIQYLFSIPLGVLAVRGIMSL